MKTIRAGITYQTGLEELCTYIEKIDEKSEVKEQKELASPLGITAVKFSVFYIPTLLELELSPISVYPGEETKNGCRPPHALFYTQKPSPLEEKVDQHWLIMARVDRPETVALLSPTLDPMKDIRELERQALEDLLPPKVWTPSK